MLTKVNVQSDNKLIRNSELKQYIKQEPNHKTFGFIPVPLYLYNMSGSDTTKWINRFLRKAGTGPCIYDEALKDRTERELKKVMANKGYIYSEIESNVITKKKKATVNYFVRTGIPLVIDTFSTIMPLDTLGTVISNELKTSFIKTGDPLDRSTLEKERVRISSKVRNVGYWGFNKDYINYTADTIDGNNLVALQMNVLPYRYVANEKHLIYKIQKIYINTDYNPLNNAANRLVKKDTVEYKGFNIVYGEKKYLTENVLTENCFIMPGAIYSDRMVDATYNAFARLQILKYVNIRFEQSEDYPDQLICNIYLTPGKNQTIQTELEGTNSAGDLGFAAAVTYQHRNIFKGSETFTAKVRGGYENLTGDVSGLIKDNYTEYGLETGLSFPKFLFPFISSERKKRIRATTDEIGRAHV